MVTWWMDGWMNVLFARVLFLSQVVHADAWWRELGGFHSRSNNLFYLVSMDECHGEHASKDLSTVS